MARARSFFEWIRRNAPTTAVIATTVPHLAYLRTGRKAVLPPFERDPDTANHLLDQVPVPILCSIALSAQVSANDMQHHWSHKDRKIGAWRSLHRISRRTSMNEVTEASTRSPVSVPTQELSK